MQAVILAGGTGTRFWPLSRRLRPKQLLALDAADAGGGGRSLLQVTCDRLAPLVAPDDVWVCTSRDLAEAVRGQLPEVPAGQVLAEPEGRNTAPAIGWSIASMPEAVREQVVAVLPADHRVERPEAFRDALARAARAAERDDRVMTLGVEPHRPETGYGHLEVGEVIDEELGARRVVRFEEKPDPETAERYFAGGRHLFNAGIFAFRGTTMLDLLARFEPGIARGLAEIARRPGELDELYAGLPRISIDYAVMERLEELGTIPLDCGWSDLGSWRALAEVLEADEEGNVRRGDVLARDAGDNLLYAASGQIAVLGVSGLVVVQTGDAVLVVPRERAQEVKAIVEELAERGRDDLL